MMYGEISNNEFFEADIENAKVCSQPDCRRVAHHCSNLLDALLVFKSWFLQRQHEVVQTSEPGSTEFHLQVAPATYSPVDRHRLHPVPTPLPVYSSAASTAAVVPCRPDVVLQQQHHHRGLVGGDDVLVMERDWAMTRAKRAESQIGRLRSACLAMRVQIEAGLRHKTEASQLKRELELTMGTINHYKNIIDEGNGMRDDLRAELARARKDASVARAQLTANQRRSKGRQQQHAVAAHESGGLVELHVGDEMAISAATQLTANMAIAGSPSPSNEGSFDGAASTFAGKYNLLQRQTFLCESLKAEVAKLKESLNSTLQKEVELTTIVDRCRSTVQQAVRTVCAATVSDPPSNLSRDTLTWLSALATDLEMPQADRLRCLLQARMSVEEGEARSRPGGRKRKSTAVPLTTTMKKKTRFGQLFDGERPSVDLDDGEFPHASAEPVPEGETMETTAVEEDNQLLQQVLSDLVTLEDDSQLVSTDHHHQPVEFLSTDGEGDSSSSISLDSTGDRTTASNRCVDLGAALHTPAGDISGKMDGTGDGETGRDIDLPFVDTGSVKRRKSTETTIPTDVKQQEVEPQPERTHAHGGPSSRSPSSPVSPTTISTTTFVTPKSPGSIACQLDPPVKDAGKRLSPVIPNDGGSAPVKVTQTVGKKTRPADRKRRQAELPSSLLDLLRPTYPKHVIDWFDLVTSDRSGGEETVATPPKVAPAKPDLRQLCVNFFTESHLFSDQLVNQLISSTDSLTTLCQVYVEQLMRRVAPQVDTSLVESRFVELCRRLRQAAGSDTSSLARLVSNWSVDNCRRFHQVGVVAVFFRSVLALLTLDGESPESGRFIQVYFFRLLKTFFIAHPKRHFGLLVLPHLLLAASSHLQQQPTGNPIVMTVQALVAWQHAHLGQAKSEAKKKKPNAHHREADVKAFQQLQSAGWLTDEAASLGLTDLMHTLRSLALRLVDNCVKSHDLESSGPALLLLLSATVFGLGDDAVVSPEPGKGPGGGESSGMTHQRARRRRRVQRQGLFGWLLTGRLLPWLEKLVKSIGQQGGQHMVPELTALLRLTTDILLLTGYLFANCPGKLAPGSNSLASAVLPQLRQTHTDSAHRLITALTSLDATNIAASQPTTVLSCLLRLLALAPDRVMRAVLTSSASRIVSMSSSCRELTTVSVFWPCPVRLTDLVQLTVELLPTQSSDASELLPAFRTWCLASLNSVALS